MNAGWNLVYFISVCFWPFYSITAGWRRGGKEVPAAPHRMEARRMENITRQYWVAQTQIPEMERVKIKQHL